MKRHLKLITALAAFLVFVPSAAAASPEKGPCAQIMNVGARQTWSLDGQWKSIVDIYETGYYDYRRKPIAFENSMFMDDGYYNDKTRLKEYDFNVSRELRVPGDWNSQRPELYMYEGSIWYRKLFDQSIKEGKRYFIYFGAANYEAVAGLNGKLLGKHTGGFTPFNFEVTSILREKDNSLVVLVDNTRRLENVPTVNFDWWNYGGLTREVCVVETPETFIREYSVQLKKGSPRTICGWVRLDGPDASQKVRILIPELRVDATVQAGPDGQADFEIPVKVRGGISCWCPENPKLYDVKIVSSTDSVSDRIGFRTIETKGDKVLLNGKEIFFRGVCVHEENPFDAGGRAWSEAHARETMKWVKEMNGNFVRLAHYPHNETMIRVAEEMGIMVWSEIPVYWTIQWDNPGTYANAEKQLEENITRDRNRANIVIWSVANETPLSQKRLEFLSKLVDKARSLDSTRLVSAAMEKEQVDGSPFHYTVEDPLLEKVDLLSFNQYTGWYDGTQAKCDKVEWTLPAGKPVFISEFGGGALAGYHGDKTERFTEEYLEELYVKNIEMLSRIPGLCGTTPWILKDFRSPKRLLTGIQDDYNRKGLISEYGQKKKAFYVMRDWYAALAEQYR